MFLCNQLSIFFQTAGGTIPTHRNIKGRVYRHARLQETFGVFDDNADFARAIGRVNSWIYKINNPPENLSRLGRSFDLNKKVLAQSADFTLGNKYLDPQRCKIGDGV